jgi:hypothetical protein
MLKVPVCSSNILVSVGEQIEMYSNLNVLCRSLFQVSAIVIKSVETMNSVCS